MHTTSRRPDIYIRVHNIPYVSVALFGKENRVCNPRLSRGDSRASVGGRELSRMSHENGPHEMHDVRKNATAQERVFSRIPQRK